MSIVEKSQAQTVIRQPNKLDGVRVAQFMQECTELDVNSSYMYLLMCSHFRHTCLIAEDNGLIIGCLCGYKVPTAPNTIFVWQIGISPSHRGQGIASQMLTHLCDNWPDIQFIEATITPDNMGSTRLFEGFAQSRRVNCKTLPMFSQHDFPGGNHNAENLFRIGPLTL